MNLSKFLAILVFVIAGKLAAQDTEAPTAPSNLVSNGTTSTSTRLYWTASTDNVGVKGYFVIKDGVRIASTGGATSIAVTGLTSGESYTFSVVARDAAGNVSSPSNIISVATLSGTDTEAPSAVTTLTASGTTATSTELSWAPSTDNVGVVSYEIYEDNNLLATTVAPPYVVTGLILSTSYSFTVVAVDAAGNVSLPGNVINVTTLDEPDTEAPSSVTTLTASGTTTTSTDLSWMASTDNVGVVAYKVFQDGTMIGTTDEITYMVDGLSANTTYAFTVLARDLEGNTSAPGNTIEVHTMDLEAVPYTSYNANLSTIDWHARNLFASESIGIGISPVRDYKLAVAGNVIAEGVKVALQSQWPDYVFMENYKLPTLKEVENHIMEKGHLIHLPSAKEVEAKGIDLGEMDALLLRKIEELTLYILQQEKKINQLENSNVELKLLSDKILNLERKLEGTLLHDK